MNDQLEVNKKIVLAYTDLAFIQHKPEEAVAKYLDHIIANTIRERQMVPKPLSVL